MKILAWLDKNLEKAVLIVVTVFMLVTLTWQVLSRYVFNASISWGEELSIFGLVWLIYFGASIAVTQRRHVRISIIPELCSPKTRKLFDIAVNIISLIFMAFLVNGTIQLTFIAYETNQRAAASGMPRWIALAGMPLAFILYGIRLIQDTVKLRREYATLAAGGTIEEHKPIIQIDGEK